MVDPHLGHNAGRQNSRLPVPIHRRGRFYPLVKTKQPRRASLTLRAGRGSKSVLVLRRIEPWAVWRYGFG
jgi:hypothetical protein